MHNFMRYLRQNRKIILRFVIIAAFLIGLLQLLNFISKNNKNNINYNIATQNIFDKTNGTIKSNQSMVSGSSVSQTSIDNFNNTIKDFVDKCNNGKAEEAYSMLTNNCKEVLYPNYETFYNNYYKRLFENNKITYSIENWAGDIFIVTYASDVLSTGKTLKNSTYQDYITTVMEDGERKLNINKYIGRVEINKEKNSDNIKTNLLYKDVFIDYEIYNMKICNESKETILMDTLLTTDGIYLKDNKDIRHQSYSNELIKDDLKIYKRTYKCYKYKI